MRLTHNNKFDLFLSYTILFGATWTIIGAMLSGLLKHHLQGSVIFLFVPCLLAVIFRFQVVKAFFTVNRLISILFVVFLFYCAVNSIVLDGKNVLRYILYAFLFLSSSIYLTYYFALHEKLKLFIQFCLLIAAVVAVYSLYVFFYVKGQPYNARLFGELGLDHPIIGSYYLSFFLLLSTSLYIQSKNWFYLVLNAVFISYIVAAQSRGAYLALLISMFFLVMVAFPRRRWLVAISSMVFAIAVMVALYYFSDAIYSRGSAHRFIVWLKGLYLALEAPIWGHGAGFKYILPEKGVWPNGYYYHAHNIFIHAWIKVGIIGLALYLMLWLYSFYLSMKHNEGSVIDLYAAAVLVFGFVAYQFDVAAFLGSPNMEWLLVWMPFWLFTVCLSYNSFYPTTVATTPA